MKEIREGCEAESEKIEMQKSFKKPGPVSRRGLFQLETSLPNIPVRIKTANKVLDHASIASHTLRYKLQKREKEIERDEERQSYVANCYRRSED
jgi:hypothetical protein